MSALSVPCRSLTRREFLQASALASGAVLAGCAANPVTGQSQLMLLGQGDEIAIDRKNAPHQLSADYGISQDARLVAYLDGFGKRMAPQTHRPAMPYRFVPVNAVYVNAYAFPGGTVAATRGPTGLVTQALLDEGHRALGLCNVAIGFQREFAAHLGVEPGRVQLEHVGLNHLTWERKVLVDGIDRLPELMADPPLEAGADEFEGMPIGFIRELGAIPSYYLHFYYRTGQVLEHQRNHRTRAEEVMEIEAGLLELYRDPSLDTKPALLEERGGAFYSDAAAPLVASLHAGTGAVQVVNVRNGGAIPNLEDDDVVEVSCTVDTDGARPLPVDPLPPEMLGLVQHAKAYERLTIAAATSGSHSYGQDSPWFPALTNKRLLASRDPVRGYTYANPRGHDMYSGAETKWIDITDVPAKVHAFTVCYFGSEEFLPECPFVLALVEFEGVNTLLLTRLMGVDPAAPALDWIGMEVKPRFLRNSKLKPTDVYFVPKDSE